jgi:hypothetical protein
MLVLGQLWEARTAEPGKYRAESDLAVDDRTVSRERQSSCRDEA